MENTDSAVRAFLEALVAEALGPGLALQTRYAQGRFVKGDPAIVSCSPGGKPLDICFSGEAITLFVSSDEDKRARLRAVALGQIQAGHKAGAAAPVGGHAFQVMVDRMPL